MSQKQLIIKYLWSVWVNRLDDEGGWVRGYELRRLRTNWGWIGSSGDRRARELANDSIIERRVKNGFVEYRYLPPQPKTTEELEKERLERLIIATS